jgi:hypothetical protein
MHIKNKIFILVMSLFSFCSIPAFSTEEVVDFEIKCSSLPMIGTTFQSCTIVDSNQLQVVLSDGSIWTITDPCVMDIYDSITTDWVVGDDIRIASNHLFSKEENFLLKNARNEQVFSVKISKNYQADLKPVFIKKVDKNGYGLVTTQNLDWSIGFVSSFTVVDWKKTDRLIINKSSYSYGEDYLLINARDGSSCRGTLLIYQ